jgi:catechol 2,3-dioxygenase-like lactoylglutathione lyase family enzyme
LFKRINGIQHIGVAVNDMDASLKFYRKFFGMNIPFFDAVAAAPLMDIYTRNETITKRASMIVNLQGGAAMEVIRPTSFEPVKADFDILPGDLGIFATQIGSGDVGAMHAFCVKNDPPFVSELSTRPDGQKTFFIKDLDGNHFQYVHSNHKYVDHGYPSIGATSCSIGVKSIEKARELYSDVLGYDKVVYDSTDSNDFDKAWSDYGPVRRILLTQTAPPGGGFGKMLGENFIELVEATDREPKTIFKDRIWADTGFVHLGFDAKGMKALGDDLKTKGFGFTCDSNDALDMGTTKVHCTYIEDPDHTWLELIEVFKVPIIEKWGIFLNVEKRDPLKPLPDFMLKALRFSRIKD